MVLIDPISRPRKMKARGAPTSAKQGWKQLLSAACVAVLSAPTLLGAQEHLAYWHLDDSGFDVGDAIDDNDGTLFGFDPAALRPEGIRGRAVEFNGTDQWIDLAHPFILPRFRGTVALWALPSDNSLRTLLYQSNAPDGEPIDYNGFGSDGDILEVHFGSASSWSFYYQDGPGAGAAQARFSVSGGEVAPGRWSHLAATWDRDGDLVLYVDCREVDRVPLLGGNFANHAAREAYVARNSENGRRFRGQIDEIRILDEPMTAAQVAPFCERRSRASRILAQHPEIDSVTAAEALIVAGAPRIDSDPSQGGAALVFEQGPDGSLSATTLVPSTVDSDSVGQLVALDDQTLVTTEGITFGNRLWIWERDPNGNWVEAAEFSTPASIRDLSLDQSWLAVGLNNLSVRLYERSAGSWNHRQTVERLDGERFGRAVALEGVDLAVSDPDEGGMLWFYRLEGDQWQAAGDLSGISTTSMVLEQGSLVVGHPDHYFHEGEVSIWRRPDSGAQNWQRTDTIRSPIPTPSEEFGTTVHLAGATLLVASRTSGFPLHPVHSYRRGADGNWRHLTTLQPLETFSWAFGRDLATNERTAYIIAPDGGAELGASLFSLPLPVFLDGFESGTTDSWSASVP